MTIQVDSLSNKNISNAKFHSKTEYMKKNNEKKDAFIELA
jgi:hypothetical protein